MLLRPDSMPTFTFKSVGNKVTQVPAGTSKTLMPYGVVTPLSRGVDNQLFKMTHSVAEQLPINLKDLILTNWGERLCLYFYGANLRVLLLGYTTQEEFDTSAITRIKDAVSKWMSYVSLVDFLSEPITDYSGSVIAVSITITYSVPQLGIIDKKLRVTLTQV